jgi:5-bromo-4-chloroindolyl phosphate hydrolysis protein
MSYRSKQLHTILLLAGLFTSLMVGVGIQAGYAQNNLRALQDRVAELEKKLADAKARQEKVQSVKMQLEEQEQKLAGLEKYLSESEKYRVQVVEIRMGISNLRVKIEAIVKEKNELEENLQLAKNLQSMLHGVQTTVRTLPDSIPKKTLCGRSLNDQQLTNNKNSQQLANWRIGSIHINDRLTNEEQKEIENTFATDYYVNQDEILNCAYRIYFKTGAILNFIVYSKEDPSNLEIILDRRELRNSSYNFNSPFSFYPTIKTLNEFKKDYFKITIKND